MAFNLRTPPKLQAKNKAYPYQLDAFRAVQNLPYAAIFHEQGLGKSKIAVDLTLYWLEKDIVDTVFIVTKKSLVKNWQDEIYFHSYITPSILSSNRRENGIVLNSPVILYVMNYEVIPSNLKLLKLFLATCRVGVILDESQKIKNPDSKLTKAFHSLTESFTKRIIMTGTPVANRPFDIWSQIKFLDEGKSLGGSFDDFKSESEIPDKNIFPNNYSSYLAKIHQKVGDFTVRETKKSSGIVLPDKTIITHFVDLEPNQSSIYRSYRDKLLYEFETKQGVVEDNAEDLLKRLLRLVQCASNPFLIDSSYESVPGKYNFLSKFLEKQVLGNSESINVIIWTVFVKNAEWLTNKLSAYNPSIVHGKLDMNTRNCNLEQFKHDPTCKILVATPGAAKEGLTLTNANHAIFFDRSFSLDDYLQAQDRIHRISQNQDCFVHNLIAKGTIDEWVDSLLNAKYIAAQLTQGDISQNEFDESFEFNLSDALAILLNSGYSTSSESNIGA